MLIPACETVGQKPVPARRPNPRSLAAARSRRPWLLAGSHNLDAIEAEKSKAARRASGHPRHHLLGCRTSRRYTVSLR
jgi:hypothetical protein